LIAFALIMLLERLAVLSGAPAVLAVVWVSVYVIGAMLLTVLWTVAGGVLDARQAKRLFPICTGAAILGGFAGTLAAGPLARLLGTESLLVLFAALLVGAAALVWSTVGGTTEQVTRVAPPASLVAELRVGFDSVRRSPMMRLVAAAYVLFAVLLFSLSFPFLRVMGESFETEADLATALGLLSASVTGVSFLVSIFVANRLYARVGVAGAAVALPIVYLAGFALWLVQFNLATALFVRFAQQVTQRGVSNAAWSALYNVVPARQRAQVLAFVDGVPGQLGTSLSGILLLVVGALLAETQIFVMGVLAALGATWIVLRIRARYGHALVATLRAGMAEQVLEGGPGIEALAHDPGVRSALSAGLASRDPATRRTAADLVARLGDREEVPDLVGAFEDSEGSVRAAAIRGIANLDQQAFLAMAPAAAEDRDPLVRGEVAVGLAQAGESAAGSALLDELARSPTAADRIAALEAHARLADATLSDDVLAAATDHSPAVRAAAMRALAAVPAWPEHTLAQVIAALDDNAATVRHAAARALAGRADATEGLLSVLRDGSGRAQEAAVEGLGAARPSSQAIREWALTLIGRADHLRRHAVPPTANMGDAEGFLAFVVQQRRLEAERRVLAAVAALGAPEASGTIRRALRSPHADVRAQAIEALDTLGDPRLGPALARLLDREPEGGGPTHGLRALADDPDPWIRGLALRALREAPPANPRSSSDQASADPDPVVRALLAGSDPPQGDAMPDTEQTLGAIERMLFLRRVPIFSQMAPEDLQRVAAAASERIYAPHEAIVNEGDLGDELVVIVRGDVIVVQGDGPDARLIRAYTSGDHIGELAILRAQPRAATVIACDEGVRGLVIGGEALRAILEERPEAAMAMLATLADRISTQ
ncbi:MAG TPA: HEAT repeat domain-containing protein, partial [Candidatus Limnocylindria bacterium]